MKSKRFLRIAGMIALLVASVFVSGIIYLFRPNELGVNGLELIWGGGTSAKNLRTAAEAAADTFFAQHKDALAAALGGPVKLVPDYSKASMIRSLGCKSCFYYYCWSIYLPYSPQPASGKAQTVIVQLNDDLPDHKHDLRKFKVIGIELQNSQGQLTNIYLPGR